MGYKIEAIDKSKAEGDAGLTTFTFKISRDHAADPAGEYERVMLKLDTPDIDAFDGFSFNSNDGRVFGRDDTRLGVRFDPGETEQTITVSIRGDTLVENDDIIRLSLTSFGVINQTQSSVSAKGIDGSASAVVLDDDKAAPVNHAAEQFHVDLVLADGVISEYEQKFILNPPTANDLTDQLIERIIQNLFASSQDGELDGNELAALDEAFTGNPAVEAIYNPARAQEIAAAELFDPPPEISFDAFTNSLATQLGPNFFNDVLLSDQVFLSVEQNQLVVSGNEVDFPIAISQVEIFDPRDQPPDPLGNDGLGTNVQLFFNGGGSLAVDTDILRLDGGQEVTVFGLSASDTEAFSGNLVDYTVEALTDNELRVTDNRPGAPDGVKVLNGVEFLAFANGVFEASEFERSMWPNQPDNIALVASTYQFFTGMVPNEGGFEFLIDSVTNTQDLNDPYYEAFNTENRFINFANNLGSFGEGQAAFSQTFGGLSFEQTIRTAFEQIIGSDAVTQDGGDPEASILFFLGAQGYYQQVAGERVVPSGIPLDQATKVVAIGSMLNEAIKADLGLFADAVSDFVDEIGTTGTSADFGMSLFA